MAYNKTAFGKTKDGKQTHLYTFENKNGMQMKVTDFGATLVSVILKGSDGKTRDVVLGHDNALGYENGGSYLGACVGRCANRIGGAAFELNGEVYQLDVNDGENNLHGGFDSYNKRVWTVEQTDERSIILSLASPHMDQGYPGNVTIKVQYTLTDADEIQIHYLADTDVDTIINLTNHSYFNLDGHDSGSILNQVVWIDADGYTETDEALIPTGRVLAVKGTPMDFTSAKVIGLENGGDYDDNFALNGTGYRRVASMRSEESGIMMEVYTDLPGMQLYTGVVLNEKNGKSGADYGKNGGACFETQYFPDAIHHEEFKKPICRSGEQYETRTGYCFQVEI